MIRRYLIRTLFILPIPLCVLGWLWSGWHQTSLTYCHAGRAISCSTHWGVVSLTRMNLLRPDGWHFDLIPDAQFWPPHEWPHVLGFMFLPRLHQGAFLFTFAVPYWFLLALSALALSFVWHWTRHKVANPNTAFPVELAAKQEPP